MMRKALNLLGFMLITAVIVAATGSDDVARVESEIAVIEAEVGAISEIECPLKIPGETEGETYSCGAYTVPVDYAQPWQQK